MGDNYGDKSASRKGVSFYKGQGRRKGYLGKSGAGAEGTAADLGKSLGKLYIPKLDTPYESHTFNYGDVSLENYRFEILAVHKGTLQYSGNAFGDGGGSDSRFCVGVCTQGGQFFGDDNVAERGTAIECFFADRGYFVVKLDGGQAAAILENGGAQPGHALGYGECSERCAAHSEG